MPRTAAVMVFGILLVLPVSKGFPCGFRLRKYCIQSARRCSLLISAAAPSAAPMFNAVAAALDTPNSTVGSAGAGDDRAPSAGSPVWADVGGVVADSVCGLCGAGSGSAAGSLGRATDFAAVGVAVLRAFGRGASSASRSFLTRGIFAGGPCGLDVPALARSSASSVI
ncbi:MAG: hypothetical protein GY772_31125 [bacterium]|nr:hypothetical protein [bacterium]